ncbi:hypothetical protein K3495_g5337 [Podosphaera aphanis]|nr:hypothetical protein K3495_g5337 [Podosphaera aphanis]
MLSPVNQQKTTSFRSNNDKLPAEKTTAPFEGEINPSTSAHQLEIPVPTVQVIPQANKPPAAIEKIDVSSIKRAPFVPTDLWNQSTCNNERTSKPSNIFSDDQLSQSASSLESNHDSIYEDLDDEEDVEEQRENESYSGAEENLSQGQYARKLLERHGLVSCKTAEYPLERLLEPNTSECSAPSEFEYNSIIGGLQYMANNTRPDIAHAVRYLAQFLANPSEEHNKAARTVLRGIAKIPDIGITFQSKHCKPTLAADSDADIMGDPTFSRSTSGLLIRQASGPVCWRSRLQRDVVLSTTEAEYLVAAETCRQLHWVKTLLQ